MPTNAFVFALAAGVISAVVFASATTGPVVLRFLLFTLTPLSLYLAGLSLGPVAVAIAAIAGTAIIVLLANPIVALAYGVSTAAPAVLLCHRALLNRETPDGLDWYPIGRLVMTAALLAGVFTVLILTFMGGDAEAMAKTMRTLVANFVKTDMPTLPGAAPLTEAQIDEIATGTLRTLPFALGIVAMTTMLFNLWLAGRITLASGWLKRPWPQFADIQLPASASFALMIATAVSFLGGIVGMAATGLSGALTVAFALVGLAVIHTLLDTSPWRPFGLWAVYVLLVVATAPMLILLAIGGLADSVFGYRDQHRPPDQNQPPA